MLALMVMMVMVEMLIIIIMRNAIGVGDERTSEHMLLYAPF